MDKNKYIKEISDIIINTNNEISLQQVLDKLFENNTIKTDFNNYSISQQKDTLVILKNQIDDFLKSKAFLFSNIKEEVRNSSVFYKLRKIENGNQLFNKILFGPPGTGKSYRIKKDTQTSSHIFRVTFHEEYSYYDFIGQYKPIVVFDYKNKIFSESTSTKEIPMPLVSYSFVSGIFIDSYICAKKNPNELIFLIIEEINRGNCSAIFGDIFQLLDRDSNGSKYPIKPSNELNKFLISEGISENILNIPPNLKIIATMNTSDQSLFPMDSAFKRRWQQEYSAINYNDSILNAVLIENTSILWLDFIKDINIKILKILANEDKQIGQWFVEPINGVILESDFIYKVISYLYYDVFKHHRDIIFKDNSFSNIITKNTEDLINELLA